MSGTEQEIRQSIESGEYYRDAMRWYHTRYHSPISERALLIIITCGAVGIILMSFVALFMLLPLADTRPMVVRVPQSLERIASVHQLTDNPREDANTIVMEWFVKDFIRVRENYDVDKQQQFYRRLKNLASREVAAAYETLYRSSESPTSRYERHTKRSVDVRVVEINRERVVQSASGDRPEIVDVEAVAQFVATEEAPSEDRKTLWVADITFRFSKIHVDQVSGAITPMEFRVTDYKSKQLGLD